MKYRAWDPDTANEPGLDEFIDASSIEKAAKKYVEKRHAYIVNGVDEVNVLVRTEDGKLYTVCIEIEYDVNYHTSRAEPYEPEPTP